METTTTITDPRPQFTAAAQTLRSVVAGIDPSQFERPTPCTDMNARELIDHIGMAVGRVTAAGRRQPLEEWPTEGFSVGDDVAAAMDALIENATTAWGDDRLAESVTLPWTTLAGAQALAVYVNEVLVHSWDLARATDQDTSFDDDAIAVAEAIIHQELPDPVRGPMWDAFKAEMPEGIPFDPPFADAVDVADDAPPTVRLAAWNGCQP
ncbi:MAG: TIGR03086 family metal-binding protein [Acidimicrobiales bacterium]|nr:TIGR03086 family metal-binding protein [Acidimicrobiales bacterium]